MLEHSIKGIEKTIHHLKQEFSKIQTGRANPAIVEDIRIDSYGMLSPIKNISSINLLDSQTLSIQPWDKSQLHAIAKAISDSGMGLNPQTMADSVLIKVPQLTEERRLELTKIAKKFSEEAKISVRNVRQDNIKAIKNSKDDNLLTEDDVKNYESQLQKMVDEANKTIDELLNKKEEDIMKV